MHGKRSNCNHIRSKSAFNLKYFPKVPRKMVMKDQESRPPIPKLVSEYLYYDVMSKAQEYRVWVTRTGTTSSAGIEIFSARLRDCT